MKAPMWTSVGEADLLVVEDGICSYEPGFPLAAFDDLPVDQLPEEIQARLDDDGYLPIPYNPTLIRIAGTTVLVDFGAGHELAREWEEPVGRAADSLAAAGVARDEIDVAVITHAHPDHVPGFTELVDGERVPTFPQARHVISKAEWRYWVDEDPGEPSAGMVQMVRPSLTALRDAGVLDLVEGDEEIADGVTLLPTPGHTPGHMSVLVTSGDETCIVCRRRRPHRMGVRASGVDRDRGGRPGARRPHPTCAVRSARREWWSARRVPPPRAGTHRGGRRRVRVQTGLISGKG